MPRLFPPEEVLARVTGVALGDVYQSVRVARPAAQPAPYYGLREEVESVTVGYIFEGSFSWEEAAFADSAYASARDAELLAVEAETRLRTDSLGLAAWRRSVQKLTEHRGVPAGCSKVQGVLVSTYAASWTQGGIEILTSFTPAWVSPSKLTGPRLQPAVVKLVLTQDRAATHPQFSAAVVTDCPG